jgi:hypothetical protein
MSGEYPIARPRARRTARHRLPAESTRSNAAIPVAIALVAVGLYLGTYTILLTGLFGLVLLVSAASLLSTRVNPLSATFYLTRKPSFLAIGAVFLGAVVLLWGAYALWADHAAPIWPHV